MRKNILILTVFIFTFLIGCTKEASEPIINASMPVYTTYEMGPNFVSHIWSIAAQKDVYEEDLAKEISKKSSEILPHWYDFMYTHKFDYLWPQIFYYIPMANDFDTEELWVTYFENWSLAIKEREIAYVEAYFDKTTIKRYINDIFETTSESLWQEVYVNQIEAFEEVEKLYINSFKNYQKKIWPEVSHKLHRKMFAINEGIAQLSLLERWENQTKLEFVKDQYKFSLIFVQPDDFQYIHVKQDTFVMPWELYKDPYDYIEYMSQRLGYTLLVQDNQYFNQVYEENKDLSKHFDIFDVVHEVTEFTSSQYNNLVMGYDTEIYLDFFETQPDYRALKWTFVPLVSGSEILKDQLALFLEVIKIDIPLEKYGAVYYQRAPFEKIFEKNSWSLYYRPGQPLIEKEDSDLKLFTEFPVSEPAFYLPKNMIAFVMPYERNKVGNIYLMDLEEREPFEAFKLDPEGRETIKSLAYDNEGKLYVIKGPAFGTFSPGGKLYKVDLKNEVLVAINIPLEDKEEIVSIHKVNEVLYVRIVKLDPSYRVDSERRIVIDE